MALEAIMVKRTKTVISGLQIILAIIVALFSFDLSHRIMSDLYSEVTGSLPPFMGLPYIYNIVGYLLAGAIPASLAYLLLYRVPNKTLIVSVIVMLLFVLYFAYMVRNFSLEVAINNLRYEIIIGGLSVVILYEAVRKIMASNKSSKPTPKIGAI